MRTLKRKEYGVFARDLGDVDLEDEEEARAGQTKNMEAVETKEAKAREEVKPAAKEAKEPAVKVKKAKEAVAKQVQEVEEDKEVAAEEVREVEAEDAGEAAPVKKRRGRLMLAVAIILVVVLIPMLYFVVIPRTELTLKVYYNESVLNQINVDSELRNGGTVAVDDLTLEISVVNSTDQEMGEHNYTVGSIAPFSGPERLEAITFRGSQYEDYTIMIDLQFSSGGQK